MLNLSRAAAATGSGAWAAALPLLSQAAPPALTPAAAAAAADSSSSSLACSRSDGSSSSSRRHRSSSGASAMHARAPTPQHHQQQPQQPQPAPYQIEVSIKAFEQRHLQQASTAVRDLMFISLSPQGAPGGPPSSASPVSLALPIHHIPIRLNWKRSRFTVIRGPHIDKTGREQFETRKYQVLVRGGSHSAQDVHWFLDSMRLYEFPGVQLQVELSSTSYLAPQPFLPPSAAAALGSGGGGSSAEQQQQQQQQGHGSLLSTHRARIARYLAPSRLVKGEGGAGAAGAVAGAGQDLEASLQSLRRVVYTGLRQQRHQLANSPEYQQWFRGQVGRAGAHLLSQHPPPDMDPSASASTSSSLTHHSPADLLLGQRLQQLSATAMGSGGGAGDKGALERSKAAAFLAAVDAVFLNLRFDALEAHQHFPFHFATYQIGQQVPAAQWMSAVLRAGQFARDAEARAQEAELMGLYTQYSLFAHSLLYTLHRMWLSHTTEEASAYLALPSEVEVQRFIQGALGKEQGGKQ